MLTVEEADSWIARTAHDSSGEQIGVITQIWVDDESGQPEWASVRSALGGREALVPLAGSLPLGGGRQFAFSREEIADAPRVAEDGHLTVEEKEEISFYYGPPRTDPASQEESWVDRLEDAAQLTRSRNAAPPAAAGSAAFAPEKKGRLRRKTAEPQVASEKESKRRFGRKTAEPQVASEKESKRRFGRNPAEPKVTSEKESKRRFGRKAAPVAEHDETSVAA